MEARGQAMIVLPVLYIISSFILIFGASSIYLSDRHNKKYRTFALLFVFMALWLQSAMLITVLPPEPGKHVFEYGLIPLLLGSFMLLLHAVCLMTDTYKRKYAAWLKLLYLIPVINVLLFPVKGWLYADEIIMNEQHAPPGPGGYINFSLMFIFMVVMVGLLWPYVRRGHRPKRILLIGILSFVLWSLIMVIIGEALGFTDIFYLVPFGILFWAIAVYVNVFKYDTFPSFERRYRLLLERAPMGIMLVDSRGVIREASPRAAQTLDHVPGKLVGRTIFELCNDDSEDMETKYARLSEIFRKKRAVDQFKLSFINARGEKKYLSVSSDFVEMDGDVFQFLLFADITEEKLREEQIHKLAYYDHLTGLYNRVSFHQVFREWQEKDRRFALIVLDLNEFKSINDRYGHLAGDQALKSYAEHLQQVAKPEDFVARLSGDEFVIMKPAGDEDHDQILASIRTCLSLNIDIDGVVQQITASVGVSICPEDGDTFDEAFKFADDRMYEEKRKYQQNR